MTTNICKSIFLVLAAASSFAHADDRLCIGGQGPGNYIVDNKTRATKDTEYGDERDVAWKGPTFYCSTSSCSYAYNHTVTVSVAYTGSFTGGFLNKTLSNTLGIQVSYTKSVSDSFTYTVNLSNGQYAAPTVIDVKRYKAGSYYGYYQANQGNCQAGAIRGTWYVWNTGYAGRWGGHFHTRGPYVTYIINGKIPQV